MSKFDRPKHRAPHITEGAIHHAVTESHRVGARRVGGGGSGPGELETRTGPGLFSLSTGGKRSQSVPLTPATRSKQVISKIEITPSSHAGAAPPELIEQRSNSLLLPVHDVGNSSILSIPRASTQLPGQLVPRRAEPLGGNPPWTSNVGQSNQLTTSMQDHDDANAMIVPQTLLHSKLTATQLRSMEPPGAFHTQASLARGTRPLREGGGRIPMNPVTKLDSLTNAGAKSAPAKVVVESSFPVNLGSRTAAAAGGGFSACLEIDQDATPQVQRSQLTGWVNSFCKELDVQKGTSVTVELMLKQVIDATAHLPAPNHLRLAVVCLLTEKMCGVLGRYTPILATLTQELFSAIFEPVGGLPTEEFVADRLAAMGLQPMSGVQRFLSRKPYYESFHECHGRETKVNVQVAHLLQCVGRQRFVLELGMGNWQLMTQRLVFLAWRGTVQRDRMQLVTLNGFLSRAQRRDTLQTHFYAFRCAVQELISERTRLQMNEGVDLIVQKEAQASVRMLDLEDHMAETNMVVKRLKEQKERLNERHALMEKSYNTELFKGEEWRELTMNAVNFVSSIRAKLSQIKHVWGADFASCGEVAVRVVLGWVRGIVTLLPGRTKLRVNNFGSDLKDGTVYICLLHVLTEGEVNLSALEHKNPHKRMEIVLESLSHINIHLCLTADDLVSGLTDYSYLILYSLWAHYALPPTPNEDLKVSEGHRQDLASTVQYLDECRSYYPQWLEHRAVLEQYAMFLMVARSKNTPAKVLSAQEEKEVHADLALMAIKQTSKIPDVFLVLPFMNTMQKAANEEERVNVNNVILKHIHTLRNTFVFYAAHSLLDDKLKKKRRAAAGGPVRKKKDKGLGTLDFTAFYRFCTDCHVVSMKREDYNATSHPDRGGGTAGTVGTVGTDASQSQAPSGGGGKAAGINRKDAKAMVRQQMKEETERREKENKGETAGPSLSAGTFKFTKAQCFTMFGDIKRRFNLDKVTTGVGQVTSSSRVKNTGLDPDSQLSPAEWIAVVLQIAIHRHGAPIVPGSEDPAPGAMALEAFIVKDLAPHACVTEGPPFLSEVWSNRVQLSLRKFRKKTLLPMYQVFAGMDGQGTMSFNEFRTVFEECKQLTKFPEVITKQRLREIFLQFGPGGELGSDRDMRNYNDDMEEVLGLNDDGPEAGPALAASPSVGGAASPMPGSPSMGNPGSPSAGRPDSHVGGRDSRGTQSTEDHELVYGEFEIALCVLAVFLDPAPFVPLVTKIERYIAQLCEIATPIVKKEEKKQQEEYHERVKLKELQAQQEAELADREKQRQLEKLREKEMMEEMEFN